MMAKASPLYVVTRSTRGKMAGWHGETSDGLMCIPASKPFLRACTQLHFRRTITAAAAVESPDSGPQSIERSRNPSTEPSTPPAFDHAIKAAVLLSRPPILTRELTSFEKAFFFYQRRLNERLALPFTRYFYYQKGTPGDLEWKRKIKERQTPARDIGRYTGYSEDTWNDEILTGDCLSEPKTQIEAMLKDAHDKEGVNDSDSGIKKEEKIAGPLPRQTEADRSHDTRSLNRALSETLYLIVRGSRDKQSYEGWMLPESQVAEREDIRAVRPALKVCMLHDGF